MVGLLLALTVMLPGPRKVWLLPTSKVTPRSLHPCLLDDRGIRDQYFRADATHASKQRSGLRRRQSVRLERLMWQKKGYGGSAARQLGEWFLESGEVARAAGRDPGGWGERARRALQAVYEQAPAYERMDDVVAGLGQAALLRCDPDDAVRWFAIYAERYPEGAGRARVQRTLTRLLNGEGKAAALALDAARNAIEPVPRTYRTPEPTVQTPRGDPWATAPAEACALDARGLRDLWAIDKDPPEKRVRRTAVRKRQVRQLEHLTYNDIPDKARVAVRLGEVLLAQAEMYRAMGHDPRAAAEDARRTLRWVYRKYPRGRHLPATVAALAHAALLRCDAPTARAWLEMYVERFPKARATRRAQRVLGALKMSPVQAPAAR